MRKSFVFSFFIHFSLFIIIMAFSWNLIEKFSHNENEVIFPIQVIALEKTRHSKHRSDNIINVPNNLIAEQYITEKINNKKLSKRKKDHIVFEKPDANMEKKLGDKKNYFNENIDKKDNLYSVQTALKYSNSFYLDSNLINHKIDYSKQIKILPEYPRVAIIRGLEGKVVINIKVDETRKITEISLGKTSGSRILDEAALNAAKKIVDKTFYAPEINLPAIIQVPIKFKLKSG